MKKNTLILCFTILSTLLVISCTSQHGFDNSFLNQQVVGMQDKNLDNPQFWQASPKMIWAKLQQEPLSTLESQQSIANANAAAWIKLAIISKRDSTHASVLTPELIAWRNQYPQHPGNQLFPSDSTISRLSTITPPKNIALLLPLTGTYADLGNTVRDGFLSAYYAESAKTSNQQTITFYDTNNQNIVGLYQQAVSKGANIVIGPLTKENVQNISSHGNLTVPTIALNYTDSWFGTANLYQFGLSPLDEVNQLADKARQKGSSRAIIIAPQTSWGQRNVKALSSRWQSNGGKISETFYFSSTTQFSKDIAALLHVNPKEDRAKTKDKADRSDLEQQRRHDFDVIFLLAPPESARQIVPLLRFYYVDKSTPIYATSIIYSGTPQPQKDIDLDGIIFCDIPWMTNQSEVSSLSNGKSSSNRLFAVGLDAYLISRELPRFTTLPNFPVYAATGALILTPQKQFYRRLAWAVFHDGHP